MKIRELIFFSPINGTVFPLERSEVIALFGANNLSFARRPGVESRPKSLL
jgi:hypothetical protein